MLRIRRLKRLVAALVLLAAVASGSSLAVAAENELSVTSDARTAEELGLLVGDGGGVDGAYLDKQATRLQAAIISLRLQGRLDEALTYDGTDSFGDANQVGQANRPVLAYLKRHPELGWSGTGGNTFAPGEPVSSQQFYKVLLEALGFRSGTDFAYAETEAFAAGRGLAQIAGTAELGNAHLATALVEALTAETADGGTLFARLQAAGVIAADAEAPDGERIGIAHSAQLGAYLTDGAGRALYFFANDAEDPEACQGACLDNWPVYYSDSLQIPATIDSADFAAIARADGTRQLTYKNWPLYYFAQDAAAGQTNGEAVNGVWFVAKSDYAVMLGRSAEYGPYLTDDYGRALYVFAQDKPRTSVCEGTCLENWPPYRAAGDAVPTGVGGAIDAIARSDGSAQTAYNSLPLYYFKGDTARGDVNGQNVNQVWLLVDPSAAPEEAPESQANAYRIDIRDFSFGTEPLTVEVGSTVTFTNYDAVQHNAVAIDGSFATPLLAQGESYTVTLSEAGTIDFFCEPHKAFMTGRIIVQ